MGRGCEGFGGGMSVPQRPRLLRGTAHEQHGTRPGVPICYKSLKGIFGALQYKLINFYVLINGSY